MQTINVFDNMTTDRWVDSGSQSTPITDGTFALTQTLVDNFYGTNFFVSASGNDGNSALSTSPLDLLAQL
ncbi:MAG: hypothetical protein K5930_03985 [Treponemataceae bacterium]|nr:hypothetical protein [Treponemataceae bacterium]